MKASEIKEKMSKISKNDISSFFQKNWKYFYLIIGSSNDKIQQWK